MNWNRAFRLHSFAQYFCTISIAFVFPISAQAAEKSSSSSNSSSNSSNYRQNSEVSYSKPDQCLQARAEADSAKRDFNRACQDSGLGSGCVSQIKKCASVMEGEEYKDDDLLLAAFEAAGVPQSRISSTCPKYSGQGYFERKDKYENDLDNTNDRLTDIKKDIANLEKDFNKEVQEVQEEIADAQKDLKQKQLDINKEQRERATEQAKTSADLAKGIRDRQTSILETQQKINQAYRNKNSSLIAISEAAAKRACIKQVRQMKKDYEGMGQNSTSSFITRASQKKKDLQNTFDECMLQMDQQRMALIEKTDQEVEKYQNTINNAQSDIDDMKQQLSSMTTQEEQAKKDDAQAMSDASTALSEKITRATTKLQSLQTSTQKESTALSEKQKYYENKSKSLSNSLINLGPVPEDETSTTKISQAQSAYDAYRDAVASIPTEDSSGAECSYDRSVLDGDSSSSRSSIGGSSKKGAK